MPASLLETATGLGMVENIALLSNSAEHDFVGVNLYCDDEAVVYNAATNVRASEIASCAGKQLEVKGDAFLARVRDDGNDVFERLDFSLPDVSSSAAWVKQAEAQNRKKAEGESAAALWASTGAGAALAAASGAGFWSRGVVAVVVGVPLAAFRRTRRRIALQGDYIVRANLVPFLLKLVVVFEGFVGRMKRRWMGMRAA